MPYLPPQSHSGTRRGCVGGSPSGLTWLNTAAPGIAEAALLSCCGSRRWARRLTDHRPYPDLAALMAAADEAAYDLAPADVAEALAAEAALPAADTATLPLPARGGLAAHTALRAAHTAYEARFGHVFVVSLDGVETEDLLDRVLASIHQRLGNDPEEERVIAAHELHRVARTRLDRLVLCARDEPARSARG
jgi:2-oxo-4-hydroxy-4-carboxy-5-ureidoimidazoline decarboxylase